MLGTRSTAIAACQVSVCVVCFLLPFACGDREGEAVQPYCSFFNNRAPRPQLTLSNCTWYRDHCCCMEQELKILFAKLKPMPGASPECIRYMNLLMCYICSPEQYKFYGREYLTVCVEFCQRWYDACKKSTIEGSIIEDLYQTGEDFCKDRNFKVDTLTSRPFSERNCFFYVGTDKVILNGRGISVLQHNFLAPVVPVLLTILRRVT